MVEMGYSRIQGDVENLMNQWQNQNNTEFYYDDVGGRNLEFSDNSDELSYKFIGGLCLKIINIVALILLNLATIGVFTFIGCILQSKKIKALKDEGSRGNTRDSYRWIDKLYKLETPPANREVVYIDQKASSVIENTVEMPDLISGAFDWAFDDIVEKRAEAVLNKSSKIYATGRTSTEYPYQNNMNAVYSWMVYLLIKNAGIEVACDQKTVFLKLNNFLKVGSSGPVHVMDERGEKNHVFFTLTDEWTPDKEKFPCGIDPVSAKYLLDDIEEPDYLEILLLQALIPDENEELVYAHEYLEVPSQANKNVRDAYILIDEIARAIGDKYHTELIERWKDKATDSTINPSRPKRVRVPQRQIVRPSISRKRKGHFEKISSVVLGVIYALGTLFVNLFTLGSLSLVYSIYLHHKIDEQEGMPLQDLNNFNEESIYRKPKYTKDINDSEFIQGDIDSLDSMITEYDSSLNIYDLDDMTILLEASFLKSIGELMEMSASKTHGLIFNNSKKIQDQHKIVGNWVDIYSENKKAVYQWMVYKLITNASLSKDEENEYRLFLNGYLSVGNSHPCEIPVKDSENKISVFINQDSWTPSPDTLRNGVEPVSVKWVLEQIKNSPLAIEALEGILLSALIPENQRVLSTIDHFISQNTEESKQVMLAYELISDLAVSISDKYKNIFFMMWDEFAAGDCSSPLLKKGGGIPVENLYENVQWKLSESALFHFPQGELVRTQQLFSPIWDDIHKYRIAENVTTINTLPSENPMLCVNILSKQYYWIHNNVGNAGCLFSALSIHMLQSAERRSDINPKSIKKSIITHLQDLQKRSGILEITVNDRKEILKENKLLNPSDSEIENLLLSSKQCNLSESERTVLKMIGQEQPGWTIEEYIIWLRDDRSPFNKNARDLYYMGDLEINLFCKTFGIGVHVFCGGDSYRIENGLMMPKKSYGPNTKEKIILFNAPGYTFFALTPKLRSVNTVIDNRLVKSSLEHFNSFWGKNDHLDWNDTIIV